MSAKEADCESVKKLKFLIFQKFCTTINGWIFEELHEEYVHRYYLLISLPNLQQEYSENIVYEDRHNSTFLNMGTNSYINICIVV